MKDENMPQQKDFDGAAVAATITFHFRICGLFPFWTLRHLILDTLSAQCLGVLGIQGGLGCIFRLHTFLSRIRGTRKRGKTFHSREASFTHFGHLGHL